jgi:hypothetical protein
MKPLFTTLLTCLFIIVIPAAACCQKNMQPGYIVTLSGDTLHGTIDYRNWINNPTAIDFIEAGKSNAVTYAALEIKRFEVSSQTYVSAIINRDKSAVGIDRLGYTEELEITADTVFLQVLFTGVKNLYYHRSKNTPDAFFIDGNSGFEWLAFKSYYKDVSGITVVQNNNQYKQQLADYFTDCPVVRAKTFDVEYKTNELKKVFREYYTCKNAVPLYEVKTDKIGFEAGVLAGASITNVSFNSKNFTYLSRGSFKSSTAVSGGLFFNILFAGKLKRLSFVTEALYNSYKTGTGYTDVRTPLDYTEYSSQIGFSYIKLNTLLRYSIPLNKVAVYINAGISNGIAISNTNTLRRSLFYYTPPPIVHNVQSISSTRKHEQGYVVGAGVRVNKLSFDIRYESGNGMSQVADIGATVTRLYLLLGYKF